MWLLELLSQADQNVLSFSSKGLLEPLVQCVSLEEVARASRGDVALLQATLLMYRSVAICTNAKQAVLSSQLLKEGSPLVINFKDSVML